MWDTTYTRTHVLLTSCTSFSVQGDNGTITVRWVHLNIYTTVYSINPPPPCRDCINGSVLPWARVPRVTNLTSLQQLMAAEGYSNKLDPTNTTLPFDVDIRIMERTKLKVATGGTDTVTLHVVVPR